MKFPLLMKNLICLENIEEFSDIIKNVHDVGECNLPCCKIGLFSGGLHLLRKNFYNLCEKYPNGFDDCFNITKNKYVFISVNLRKKKKKKKERKKLETAVKIEKNIENLSSLIKFDQFINLGYFCHVCCCQKDKCGKCLFLCNLWYIFVEIKVNQTGSVEKLQSFVDSTSKIFILYNNCFIV